MPDRCFWFAVVCCLLFAVPRQILEGMREGWYFGEVESKYAGALENTENLYVLILTLLVPASSDWQVRNVRLRAIPSRRGRSAITRGKGMPRRNVKRCGPRCVCGLPSQRMASHHCHVYCSWRVCRVSGESPEGRQEGGEQHRGRGAARPRRQRHTRRRPRGRSQVADQQPKGANTAH